MMVKPLGVGLGWQTLHAKTIIRHQPLKNDRLSYPEGWQKAEPAVLTTACVASSSMPTAKPYTLSPKP